MSFFVSDIGMAGYSPYIYNLFLKAEQKFKPK